MIIIYFLFFKSKCQNKSEKYLVKTSGPKHHRPKRPKQKRPLAKMSVHRGKHGCPWDVGEWQ